MKIKKRNGSLEEFDKKKIYKAIMAAYNSVYSKKDSFRPTKRIKDLIELIVPETYDSVEKIQDAVEDGLMDIDKKVAKSYIRYRYLHEIERNGIREMEEDQKYMYDYQTSGDNAAESSNTDPNANMTVKSIPNMEAEIPKKRNRRMQRFSMHGILEKLYDKDLADMYVNDLKSHIIYAHDEASSEAQKPYCYAPQMYPLLYGTDNLDGTGTKAPDNLDSFCGQLINATFLLASNCRGAVAWSEFFNFFDYFCVKEWGENYDLKKDNIVTTADCLKQRTIKGVIKQKFQQIVFNWNQPASNRGAQSPFINISYFDSGYWHALFDKFTFPDGSKPEWRRVDFLQRLFMKWFNKERTEVLLTFPVEVMALLDDGKKVIDEKYEDLNAEMYSEGHSFFTYVNDNPTSISSCCRLENKLHFNFTTGLTGVETGSCNVITLNLNRISQNWIRDVYYKDKLDEDTITPCHLESVFKSEELRRSFVSYLSDIVERVHKYHIGFKTLLYDEEKRKMFPPCNAGYIHFNKLYSTVGINGINEAAEFFGMTCHDNEDYKNFCRLITDTIAKVNRKNSTPKFMFNTEFVPAESLGSKNYKWDKKDGYWVPKDRNLYNSYFYIASDPNTSVLEKFRLHGRAFTELCDGGTGLHVNLDDHLSKEQYKKLLRYAIKTGCKYFTYNIPNCQCDKCGHIEKHHFDKCPKCGSKETTDWTRIIG